MSNKNLKTLSASHIRGRYDSEPIENVRCMENDINANNNNSSSHLSSLYSRDSNSTFADNNPNSIKTDNNSNKENASSNSINVNSNCTTTTNNNNNNNDEDSEWKRDKLLRGSYVINEDYRRSERDNAQMINFLRERASALNKSRLAL